MFFVIGTLKKLPHIFLFINQQCNVELFFQEPDNITNEATSILEWVALGPFVPFCLKTIFPYFLYQGGMLNSSKRNHGIPGAGNSVFWCGVFQSNVAISFMQCCKCMCHRGLDLQNCFQSTKYFLYISTEDQLPCRTKHYEAFFFSVYPWRCLFFSIVATAQVPVELY